MNLRPWPTGQNMPLSPRCPACMGSGSYAEGPYWSVAGPPPCPKCYGSGVFGYPAPKTKVSDHTNEEEEKSLKGDVIK